MSGGERCQVTHLALGFIYNVRYSKTILPQKSPDNMLRQRLELQSKQKTSWLSDKTGMEASESDSWRKSKQWFIVPVCFLNR